MHVDGQNSKIYRTGGSRRGRNEKLTCVGEPGKAGFRGSLAAGRHIIVARACRRPAGFSGKQLDEKTANEESTADKKQQDPIRQVHRFSH